MAFSKTELKALSLFLTALSERMGDSSCNDFYFKDWMPDWTAEEKEEILNLYRKEPGYEKAQLQSALFDFVVVDCLIKRVQEEAGNL